MESASAKSLAADANLEPVSARVTNSKLDFGGIPLTALDRFLTVTRGVDREAALPG